MKIINSEILNYIDVKYKRLIEDIKLAKLNSFFELGYLKGQIVQLMELAQFFKLTEWEDEITNLYLELENKLEKLTAVEH